MCKMTSKKISVVVSGHVQRADYHGRKLRVFFQDEGRFGRISDPRSCWAPPQIRPVVKAHHIREYIYAFAAICPHDGQMSSFIADQVNAQTMSQFLQQVAHEYPNDDILMVLDGASWHRAKELHIPQHMTLILLPPYSPELNPVEHLWDELREKYFANRCFGSLDAVEQTLALALHALHKSQPRLFSMCGFPWITEQAQINWH
jgi:transposase